MDQDTITWTGARTPGAKRQKPLARWCTSATAYPDLVSMTTASSAVLSSPPGGASTLASSTVGQGDTPFSSGST